MKTIREGRTNVDKPWVGRKIECSNCDFLGKLEPDDKVRIVLNQQAGGFYCVRCPNCKAFMNLAASLRR